MKLPSLKDLLALGIILTLAYSLAAMFSSHVYMDFSRTEWGNAWTWLWLGFWVLLILGAGSGAEKSEKA